MKDAGHRACVEAALKFEKTDRTPVNNFAVVTSARSAGCHCPAWTFLSFCDIMEKI